MNQTIEALADGAAQLPPDQRLALACRIRASMEPEGSPEVDAAWDAEIRERIRRYDSGETASVPANGVFDAVDQRLRR